MYEITFISIRYAFIEGIFFSCIVCCDSSMISISFWYSSFREIAFLACLFLGWSFSQSYDGWESTGFYLWDGRRSRQTNQRNQRGDWIAGQTPRAVWGVRDSSTQGINNMSMDQRCVEFVLIVIFMYVCIYMHAFMYGCMYAMHACMYAYLCVQTNPFGDPPPIALA